MIPKPYQYFNLNHNPMMSYTKLYWTISYSDFIKTKLPKSLQDSFDNMNIRDAHYEIAKRMNKKLSTSSIPLYYFYNDQSKDDITIFYNKDIYLLIKYDGNLYGNQEEQLKLNSPSIEKRITTNINMKINSIFSTLERDIEKSLDKLIDFNLPYTKPIVLAKIFNTFKEAAAYTADNFKDPSIKRSILSVLWLK